VPDRRPQHRDRPDDLRLHPGVGRLRPPRVARHALAWLIRERLERRGRRFELT
jgi:hypothetical protein